MLLGLPEGWGASPVQKVPGRTKMQNNVSLGICSDILCEHFDEKMKILTWVSSERRRWYPRGGTVVELNENI